MRALLATAVAVGLTGLARDARADLSVGASVGAGAQGASTYSALELRLDGQWKRGRLGLGVRGVWDDAAFRSREWASRWSAVRIVRALELRGRVGRTRLALAAGALAPSHVGSLVDGYRVSLDDRWRTGARGVARSKTLELGAEIDDVLDPALIGGGVRWLVARPWGVQANVAIDPDHATAAEAGVHRRVEGKRALAELGVSVVGEVADRGNGASAVAFATASLERAGIRFSARGDVRAGTGSAGGLFGPLWRVERLRAVQYEGVAAGAGASIGMAAPRGWLELGARARPELGRLVVVGAGAPMGRWVQGGLWAAIGRDDAAGAAELRVAWANTLFSALQAARIYRLDVMEPSAVWSITAWFGAATR